MMAKKRVPAGKSRLNAERRQQAAGVL